MASSFFPAAFLFLLAASTTPACTAGQKLASYGFPLAAAFAVPTRAARQLITSHAATTAAHGAVAGCLVLVKAFAVPARATGRLLALPWAPTRAHRATLGYIFLTFTACAVPARVVVGSDFYPYANEGYMRVIAKALGADRALNWTNDPSPCGWTGVSCDTRGRVSQIRVRNKGLNGTLPQDIGSLLGLRELDLRHNSISGDIPDVAFLDILKLRLDGNQFSSVPVSFLSFARSLQFFSISNNLQLRTWELPHNPRRLDTLHEYAANDAQLSGTLSGFLRPNFFHALRKLSMGSNFLTGDVPATLASRTLTHLNLSYNRLTGPLDFVANLPRLEVLLLNGNGFTGPLPDFSRLRRLQILDLAHNRLTGVVPASLVGLGSLDKISITDNLFQGPLPMFARVVRTDVAEASLNGSFCRPQRGPCDRYVESFIAIAGAFRFPEALASSWKGNRPCNGWLGVYCDKDGEITGVNFCRLGLNGTLHPAFGDFKTLVMLNLANNNITGEVPRSITTIHSLKVLDISNNSLAGKMPTFPKGVTIWAGGNNNLTVSGASRLCISDVVRRLAAAAAIVVLVLA